MMLEKCLLDTNQNLQVILALLVGHDIKRHNYIWILARHAPKVGKKARQNMYK
jgi:hypothetical protein